MMTSLYSTGHGLRRQKGSALLVALIMLLLISLIAVASMQDTIMQDRMVTNTTDRSIAFENAEAALRDGEQRVWLQGGVANAATISPPTNWASATPGPFGALPVDSRTASAPEYHVGPPEVPTRIFTELASDGAGVDLEFYRITSRGAGARDSTEVLLRSVFGRPN